MKKKVIIICLVLLVVIGSIFLINLGGKKETPPINVMSVESIMNGGVVVSDRYSGVIVTQEMVDISKDTDRQIEEILVSVGQEVTEGTALFKYSVGDVQIKIDSIGIEKESIQNEINNRSNDIEELRNRLNNGDASAQHEINAAYKEIKRLEYDLQLKEVELGHAMKQLNDSTVVSTTKGVIRSINQQETQGEQKPFIQISQSSDFRVEGKVDEQSVSQLSNGQNMLIRSRFDESKVWTGKITKVVTSPSEEQNQNGPSGMPSAEKMSMYKFYVSLDNPINLLLGQHVYIEQDLGQTQTKEGIWLSTDYIVMEEKPYVWGMDSQGKLKKIMVEIGEVSDQSFEVEVKSGLTKEDYISWPMPELKEGMKATKMENMYAH